MAAPLHDMIDWKGSTLTAGFLSTLVLWTTWFITHLPWLGMSEQVALPVVLTLWGSSLIWSGWRTGARRWLVGGGAGTIAAVIGLLILGSKLTHAPDATAMDGANVKPHAGVMAVGFVVLGAVLGATCGWVGGVLRGVGRAGRQTGHGRDLGIASFALVTVLTAAPLVFIGGLVTSTNSGMAVPDWPNTFGSNMFLYPLGPRVPADIYFEHSHRLFGTLVGLTALVLMVWTMRSAEQRWLRPLVIGVFAFIVLQGVIGGLRVLQGSADATEDNRWWSMAHGIKGQLIFALLVAIAVFMMPAYGAARSGQHSVTDGVRLRFLATAALHSTILQLFLGAMYRHLRHDHVLWAHAGFALIVAGLALMAGVVARNLGPTTSPLAGSTRRLGLWLTIVVSLQFVLGWATFLAGGRGLAAGSEVQALLRTAHQANGAAMLGLITAVYLISRQLAPKRDTAARLDAAAAGS